MQRRIFGLRKSLQILGDELEEKRRKRQNDAKRTNSPICRSYSYKPGVNTNAPQQELGERHEPRRFLIATCNQAKIMHFAEEALRRRLSPLPDTHDHDKDSATLACQDERRLWEYVSYINYNVTSGIILPLPKKLKIWENVFDSKVHQSRWERQNHSTSVRRILTSATGLSVAVVCTFPIFCTTDIPFATSRSDLYLR